MSTYTQILYQLVFSTKERENTLISTERDRLYKYIWGILQKHECHLYRIGGVENHIHIITHIHPSIGPAVLVKDIKLAASDFIKKEKIFPMFRGWQDGYGAFTYTISAKENLIEYVKNQEEHHKRITFKDEYITLLKEHGIDFNDKYLF
jgi:putative transposase